MSAGRTAAEHREVFLNNLWPLGIAYIVWSLWYMRDLLKIETWRGRLLVYISKTCGGFSTGYIFLLAIPHANLIDNVENRQLAAFCAFVIGCDGVGYVIKKLLGIWEEK